MKVLLDEHLPPALRGELPGHDVFTVRYMGWDGLKNGELIAQAASSGFDVLVSMDAGIPHQHNLATIPLAVIILEAQLNDMNHLHPLVPKLQQALAELDPRTVVYVS